MALDLGKTTEVFDELRDNFGKRITGLYGGSGSSKTISAMQILTGINLLQKKKVTTIVGESVPVLKRSVIRDWQNHIMGENYVHARYNKSEMTYTFPSGSIFQFVPGDDPSRFHGPRQDYLLMDEIFNIPKAVFDQAEIRTSNKIFLTWNPVADFWGKNIGDRQDAQVFHSTYHNNPYLEESIRNSLELRAELDPNFYRVYVLGKYGNLEGLVFTEGLNWKKVKHFPFDKNLKPYWKWRVFGLDFGYTHDPTALVEIRFANGELYWMQHIYEKELTNDVIADRIIKLGFQREDIIADSAEPKSIEEIRLKGVNIRGAEKGPDSVNFGIDKIKQYKNNVIESSVDLIKEFRNYSWATDKHGEYTRKPLKGFDHLLDGGRYGLAYKLKYQGTGQYAIS